jgi:glycosyltransferase involved in cell wall biosynthesis
MKKAPHICFVHYSAYPALGRIAFYEFSRQTAALGLRTSVIALAEGGAAKKSKLTFPCDVHNIAASGLPPRFDRLLYSLRVASLLNRLKPDIVHSFFYRGCSLLPILQAGRSNGRTRYLADVRSGHLSSGLVGAFGRRVNRFELGCFDSLATISPDVDTWVFGRTRRRRRLYHFPVGVDYDRFAKPEHGEDAGVTEKINAPPGHIIAIYAGTISRLRDLGPLLHATKRVVSVHPEFCLVIAGDGPDVTRLKKVVHELGIEQKVRFLGRIPYSEIHSYYQAADIGLSFVPQVTNFNGQPPLKTFEFLAAGLAVVATDIAGNRLAIRDGENGLLSSEGPVALAQRILEICNDRDLLRRLADCGCRSARRFEWRQIVESKLLPAYREILNGN